MARIKAFRVKRKFTVISITGGFCELGCSHCSSRYIRTMLPAPLPERMPRLLEALHRRGVLGVLVSGGWTRDAVLPVERFLEPLGEAKRRLGLVYNVHLGLWTDRELLARAAEVFDLVDFEYTENRWMAVEVRGVPGGVERYRRSLEAMLEAGLNVVPHLFLWHPNREPDELKREMKSVWDLGVERVNLLVYIPPEGDIDMAVAEKLPEMLREARSHWPGELYLGCMRPPTARRILDPVAIGEELVDRIANPSLRATRMYGERLEFYDACCSLPEGLLERFRLE